MSRHTSSSRKISFNVSDQYEIQDVVGEGAYGVVWYVFSYLTWMDFARYSKKLTGLIYQLGTS